MEDILYISIGNLIKEARLLRGLTQQELGDLVKLTRASIANIERGSQKVSINNLYQIADILKVAPQSLLPDPNDLEKPKSNLYADINDLRFLLSEEEFKWVNQLKKKVEFEERDENGNNKKD